MKPLACLDNHVSLIPYAWIDGCIAKIEKQIQDDNDNCHHENHRLDYGKIAPLDGIKVQFIGATWKGGEVVKGDAPAGESCLKIVDENTEGNVTCATDYTIPVERGAAYRLSWRVKTAKAGQEYLVTLNTHDRDGNWIPHHNIDLLRRGSGQYRRGCD